MTTSVVHQGIKSTDLGPGLSLPVSHFYSAYDTRKSKLAKDKTRREPWTQGYQLSSFYRSIPQQQLALACSLSGELDNEAVATHSEVGALALLDGLGCLL